MPIVLIILVGSVLLARGGAVAFEPWGCACTLGLGTAGPLGVLALLERRARACLVTARVVRAERARRLVAWASTAAVAVATHAFGWLAGIRGWVGDVPALDEAIAILPAVAAMVAATWIHWPLEEALRRVSWLERVEAGLPPVPATGRTRATLEWARGGSIVLVLVPVLAVLAASESAERLLRSFAGEDAATFGSFAAAVAALVVSPVLLRWSLGLRPLPAGPVRDDIAIACAAHRIRLAGTFLWPTGGLVANAAILGFLPRFRFLLLSDLLLAGLSRDELLAVVEHELAHVRRRHLPWLALAVASLAALAACAVTEVLPPTGPPGLELPAGLATAMVAFLGLGWVSRRFERQADAFAAAELSRRAGSGRVEEAAIFATISALDRVAELAHVDPRVFSWRHGSIRVRQRNLRALAGVPIGGLPIDRTVRRIKLATLAATILAAWLLSRPVSGAGYDATAATGEGPSACVS